MYVFIFSIREKKYFIDVLRQLGRQVLTEISFTSLMKFARFDWNIRTFQVFSLSVGILLALKT